MTTCTYRTGRQVPVLLAPLCADTVLDPGWFHLLLLESGCFRGRTGNTTYVAAGHSLLCLPPDSAFRPLEIRHSSGLHLAFAPEFINVGLHAPALHPSCYEMIRETQGYPDFRVFADDPGILGLDDAAYAYMRKSLERIRVQLEEQPDPKWSCRDRGDGRAGLPVYPDPSGRGSVGWEPVQDICHQPHLSLPSVQSPYRPAGVRICAVQTSGSRQKQPGVHLPLSGGDRKGMRVPGERLSGARVQAACGDNPAFLPHRHAEKADGIGW